MPKNIKEKEKNSVCPVKARVPIVTILGHVDHGKTTILDKIRDGHVQTCEAGGITQKVSVFTVDVGDGKSITFVDTPGHEAFDLMRSRGGSIADIVLLIVAGDDGVKPQTEESIEIIKNSTAKPIVVINKCDLPDINVEKIKRDVTNRGLQLEGLGGTIPVVEVSGKTGKGIPELLNLISLVAEVEGLREDIELPKGVVAKVFVLESVKDAFKGNVSSIASIQGCACQGDWFGYKLGEKLYLEKIKAMITEDGLSVSSLDCGCGGKIIGLSNLLDLGTEGYILSSKDERLLSSLFVNEKSGSEDSPFSVDDFFSIESNQDGQFLNVSIKSSSEGSLEAILNTLEKLEEDSFKVKVVNSGVGNITLRDVEFAHVSKSILLGFEVNIEQGVLDYAKKNKVLVKTYDIIYKLIEEVSDALAVMSLPQESEEEIGSAVIKTIFTLSDGSQVLGCKVSKGIMKRDCKVYVVRNDEIITESKIKSLRINKDVVTEVKSGFECGIQLSSSAEIREGDEVYCYKKV